MLEDVAGQAGNIAAASSLLSIFFYGKVSKYGPLMGLASQIPWAVFGVSTGQWLLLASVLIYSGLHLRNLHEFRKFVDEADDTLVGWEAPHDA